MIILLASLCAVIALVGLASVIPWGYIWRSCQSHMAAKLGNTGMKEKFIQAIPTIIYGKSTLHLTGLSIATDCAICTAEFMEGEGVRVLPKCNHGFHMECIDNWLRSHSSCPTCRHCLRIQGYKNMADHIHRIKSNVHEEQPHKPRISQESREILDMESGIKP